MNLETTCVFVDAPTLAGFAGENAARFREAARGVCDFYVAVHPGQRSGDPETTHLYYSDSDIFDCVPHSKDTSRGVVPGNWDLKMVRVARDLPRYDRFLRIEYDVVMTREDHGDTLQRVLALLEGADLVTSFVSPHKAGDAWMWWKSFEWPGKDWRTDQGVVTMRSFCPVLGYSRRFIEAYADRLGQGLRGHGEVTLTTAAATDGFTIVDLADRKHAITSFPQFTFDRPSGLEVFVPPLIHPLKSSADYAETMGYIRSLPANRA